MEEKWSIIEEFPNYQISTLGRIMNKSASEASRQTGINRSNICNVCRKALNQHGNPYKTAGGYK